MVSVCLPSDALLQHLPSYLGFSYLGRGVSLQGCSSKAQPLLLTLDEGYLLTAALPDLQCGIAPLSPPAPGQPQVWVTPPLASGVGRSSRPPPLTSDPGLFLSAVPAWLQSGTLGCCSWPRTWGNSSWPPPFGHGVLLASAPDLGRGVASLGLWVFKKKLQSLEMLIPTLYVTVYIPWWHRYKGWL